MLGRSTNDTTPGMFMISTSNRFAVLGKKNVKKTYLAAAIRGLVKEKERKAAMRRYVKTHPEVATRRRGCCSRMARRLTRSRTRARRHSFTPPGTANRLWRSC